MWPTFDSSIPSNNSKLESGETNIGVDNSINNLDPLGFVDTQGTTPRKNDLKNAQNVNFVVANNNHRNSNNNYFNSVKSASNAVAFN